MFLRFVKQKQFWETEGGRRTHPCLKKDWSAHIHEGQIAQVNSQPWLQGNLSGIHTESDAETLCILISYYVYVLFVIWICLDYVWIMFMRVRLCSFITFLYAYLDHLAAWSWMLSAVFDPGLEKEKMWKNTGWFPLNGAMTFLLVGENHIYVRLEGLKRDRKINTIKYMSCILMYKFNKSIFL